MSPEYLNHCERAVLEQMARGHPEAAAIRAQLEAARVTLRQRNGHGFFTYLQVPHESLHRISSKRPIADAWAHVKGLDYGMNFLLWTDDEGFLDCLEGAGFGEDIEVVDFDAAQMEFYEVPEGLTGFNPQPPSWATS